MNDVLYKSSLTTIVLHWVDSEIGADKPFCGQKGGVLMTSNQKLATCKSCAKKLLFLDRIREACRKNPLIVYPGGRPHVSKPDTRTA